MKLFRLHVKKGVDEPEDWGRVLVPFAGTGLRLVEEFHRDCIIEAGPLLIKDIMHHLGEYVELFDYDPMEKESIRRQSEREEESSWW